MHAPVFMDDFTYELPPERIAGVPLPQRDASKLLVYQNGKIEDDTFSHIDAYLPAGSLLVLNDTRVLEARLRFEKPTGGVIEIFCLEPYEPAGMEPALQQTATVQWRCLIGGASKWAHGLVLKKGLITAAINTTLEAVYMEKETDSFVICFRWTGGYAFADVLHAAGTVPLPPYIKRKAAAEDAERYQTVFAEHKGSVAAPTAALHFTHGVFEKLAEKKIGTAAITLHVGAGTFKPVKGETIAEHHMHAEHVAVSRRFLEKLLHAETIVAVGTTSLRTLESLHWLGVKLLQHGHAETSSAQVLKKFELAQWEAYDLAQRNVSYKESIQALLTYLEENGKNELHCRTSLLIQPGYIFRSAQALITNFHQPRSTLLLLIAAFIGDDWKRLYRHALENNYRFLSYGDSSLLWRSLQS